MSKILDYIFIRCFLCFSLYITRMQCSRNVILTFILTFCFVIMPNMCLGKKALTPPSLFTITDYLLQVVHRAPEITDVATDLKRRGFTVTKSSYSTTIFKGMAINNDAISIISDIIILNDIESPYNTWLCYKGALSVDKKYSSQFDRVQWIVCIQDAGSLRLVQPTAFLVPEKLLSMQEIKVLEKVLHNKYSLKTGSIVKERHLESRYIVYDFTFPIPALEKIGMFYNRLSCYIKEISPDKYQFVILVTYE